MKTKLKLPVKLPANLTPEKAVDALRRLKEGATYNIGVVRECQSAFAVAAKRCKAAKEGKPAAVADAKPKRRKRKSTSSRIGWL